MQYQVLGPVRIIDGDTVLSVSAPKMETILATLLSRFNQVVSIPQLMTEIWGDNRPRRATPTIHVYISQLRKLLGRTEHGGCPIDTRPPGYQLNARPADIDCHVFQSLVGSGREQLRAGQPERAHATLTRALDLWHGPALDRNGPIINGFVNWLEELRLECVELRVEAALSLGRHRELVSDLYQLTAEHPLHEVFYGQLMRALHASGRRGDALRVYRDAWDVLDRELGLAPAQRLQRLQHELLTADDDCSCPRPTEPMVTFRDSVKPCVNTMNPCRGTIDPVIVLR